MRRQALGVFLAAAVGATLVIGVAGAAAKPVNGNGDGSKCEKPKRVGFKVNGTFDSYVGTQLTVDPVTRANRHADDWLETNSASFETDGVEKVKFIGVTDTGTDGVGFEDAVAGDRVKLKAKLALPKKDCAGEPELEVKKIKVKRPHAD